MELRLTQFALDRDFTAEKHEVEIIDWIGTTISSKYRAGQKEHGGRLWRKPMLGHMIEEITDLVVYMATHRGHFLRVLGLLYEALEDMDRAESAGVDVIPGRDAVQAAFNILTTGNEEGEEEEELG